MHIRRDIRRCIDTARQDKSPAYRPGLPGPPSLARAAAMSDGKTPVANWVVGRMGARATASQTPSESEKKLRNSSGIEFNC